MRVTPILAGAAAILLPATSAYPWLDPELSEVQRRQLLGGLLGGGSGGGGFLGGLLGGGNTDGGQGAGGIAGLISAFQGLTTTWSPANVNRLSAEMHNATQEVLQRAAANPRFPGWPKTKLMDATGANITAERLYDTYGLWRGGSCGDLRPGGMEHGGGEWSSTKGGLDPNLTMENCDWGIWGPAENDEHPYQEPGPNDQRGPCPGLNTIANYGYIPRNGIASARDLILGVWEGLSCSPDVAALLVMAAMVFKGDMQTTKVSIGGKVSGAGNGIREHGILEGDASVTRQDLALGNNWKVDDGLLNQFKEEMQTYGNGEVTPTALANSRYRAYQNSLQKNSQFDFNPLRAIVAYAESGFGMEVFRGQNSRNNVDDIDHWFRQSKFPPNWSRRSVPITQAELLSWGMHFYNLKPTDPGNKILGAFVKAPSTANWLGTGTLHSNGCNFGKFIATLAPNGAQIINNALEGSGLVEFNNC